MINQEELEITPIDYVPSMFDKTSHRMVVCNFKDKRLTFGEVRKWKGEDFDYNGAGYKIVGVETYALGDACLAYNVGLLLRLTELRL